MLMGKWHLSIVLLIAVISLTACSLPTPTPDIIPPVLPTSTPTQFPTPTATPSPSPTATITLTPSPTFTPTALFLALPGTDLPAELPPIWYGNANQVSALAEFHQDTVRDLAWEPAGNTLAVAGSAGINLYDVDSRTQTEFLSSEKDLVSIAFEPNRNWLAASFSTQEIGGGYTGGYQLWSLPAYMDLGPFLRENQAVGDLEFSYNGQFLAVGFTGSQEDQNRVTIWNTNTWEISRTLTTGLIQSIAYAPDTNLLATSPDRYAVKIWQIQNGRVLHTIYTSFTGAVNCLTFSPDGTALATGHYDGHIRIWDTTTADLLHDIDTGSVVESLAFNPDGTILASGGSYQDSLLILWDMESAQSLRVLEGHSNSIDSLLFSPNGQMLASGSYDGTVRLWGIRP